MAASIAALGLASPGASAVSYYLFVDVPAQLAGSDYTSDQIVRSDNGAYSVQFQLGEAIALERTSSGRWLLVPESPVDLGGGVFAEARDVVLTDGIGVSLLLDGSSVGIPDYARIDALFLEDSGDLVLSFDVPVGLAGTEYGASDLVRFSGGLFSSYWDAKAAGIPEDANLVGADLDGAGKLVLTFDVPVTLDGTDYLPGTLVVWSDPGFASYFTDPAWPAYAKLRDFSFVPGSGQVPGDPGSPGTPLTVTRNSGTSELTLAWGASCQAGDTDYEIYEGVMGPLTTQGFYTHSQKFCTTGGLASKTFPEPGGAVYYLVVPHNAVSEGSYGLSSNLAERPAGTSACLAQQIAGACP